MLAAKRPARGPRCAAAPGTPIPAGYAEENPVVLPAPQSYFGGQLRYHNTSGYAHHWIDGWTRREDFVYWEIDVVHAGEYEAALALCLRGPRRRHSGRRRIVMKLSLRWKELL
ncbi:MAG: hypothetical protein ACE15B_22555 [Bryobacteraceae bacterium]